MKARPRPKAFASAQAFRGWLAEHHGDTNELHLRLFKTHARARGLTYRDALDEALCYGWIDGVVHALDSDSFSIRFTPRRRGSRWSARNVRRAKELIAAERMEPAGRAAFDARPGDAAGYSFESQGLALAPAYERRFRASARAWERFQARSPSYRRTCVFWVMSAKREETRERRLAALIDSSARGESVPPLRALERPRAKRGRSGPAKSRR
jgi:uncharacterized protein YdeI (YjbR/CyaY-like superfamily)